MSFHDLIYDPYRGFRQLILSRALSPQIEFLAVSAPFPQAGPGWTTLVTIPAASLLGPVFASNRRAALIAAAVALFGVLLGIAMAERFVRPLSRVARDLDAIGRLEFPEGEMQDKSVVKEISDMIDARNRMTGGLRSFSKYVPANLVRELMARGQEATLGGETRSLTVYFSDIVGFTSFAEKLTPQELVDALAEYLGEMSDLIQGDNGTVDKYIGDAIMAFWGAPQDVPDHAARACRTALNCQTSLVALRERYAHEGLPEIRARIGLNSGDCLVGNIGSISRMNYTVMGDPVNVASRLEAQCKTYGIDILIGEKTRELAGGDIVVRPVDKIAVKGKVEGLVVYELLAMSENATSAELIFSEDSHAAFSAYLDGKFGEAAASYAKLSDSNPSDVASSLLLERCKAHQLSPPSSWDGVMRLTTK